MLKRLEEMGLVVKKDIIGRETVKLTVKGETESGSIVEDFTAFDLSNQSDCNNLRDIVELIRNNYKIVYADGVLAGNYDLMINTHSYSADYIRGVVNNLNESLSIPMGTDGKVIHTITSISIHYKDRKGQVTELSIAD